MIRTQTWRRHGPCQTKHACIFVHDGRYVCSTRDENLLCSCFFWGGERGASSHVGGGGGERWTEQRDLYVALPHSVASIQPTSRVLSASIWTGGDEADANTHTHAAKQNVLTAQNNNNPCVAHTFAERIVARSLALLAKPCVYRLDRQHRLDATRCSASNHVGTRSIDDFTTHLPLLHARTSYSIHVQTICEGIKKKKKKREVVKSSEQAKQPWQQQHSPPCLQLVETPVQPYRTLLVTPGLPARREAHNRWGRRASIY